MGELGETKEEEMGRRAKERERGGRMEGRQRRTTGEKMEKNEGCRNTW